MPLREAVVRLAGTINMAIASASALGYVNSPEWLMHLMLWPALAFIPVWTVAVIVKVAKAH